MKSNKIIVYLAELAHDGFGLSLNTIPLGIGVVGAYSKKFYGDKIELRLFRHFNDLMKAILDVTPHIVGFGYFSWNDNLTPTASAWVREVSRDSLIVIGGPNISFEVWEKTNNNVRQAKSKTSKLCSKYAKGYDLALLKNNPSIDTIVHGDGEVPFSNILGKYLDSPDRLKVRKEPIDGCTSLYEGQLNTGKPVDFLFDLDLIPSPYLTGLYSEFLEHFQLIPQIETVRGCPYECTYCTIGGNTNKLRKHSTEYVKEEILYLKDNSPTGILRIADSNWGILKNDVELAEFIRKLHDISGYPSSLRVYYAEKGPFENVRKMADKLKALLPLNMSFQTLTKEVLNNVKRKNMPITKVREMVEFAHNNDIAVSTELISGLPGETYESFRKVFLDVVKLNFDSVYVQPLYLTKGSELYTDIARNHYGFSTMYSLIGKDVTEVNSRYVFEADEVVVESNEMSIDDFWELHKFNLFVFICYGAAFLKEIIMHCMNYDITPLDIYDELFTRHDRYPFLNKMFAEYIGNVQTKYFKTLETLEEAVTQAIKEDGNIDKFSIQRQLFYYVGAFLSSRYKPLLISECAKAAISIYCRKSGQEGNNKFHSILKILSDFALDMIISPLEKMEEKIFRQCEYDLVAWSKDEYRKPLSQYFFKETKEFLLGVRNIDEHRSLIRRTADWDDDVEKYLFYFTTVVSSNMRRYIANIPS